MARHIARPPTVLLAHGRYAMQAHCPLYLFFFKAEVGQLQLVCCPLWCQWARLVAPPVCPLCCSIALSYRHTACCFSCFNTNCFVPTMVPRSQACCPTSVPIVLLHDTVMQAYYPGTLPAMFHVLMSKAYFLFTHQRRLLMPLLLSSWAMLCYVVLVMEVNCVQPLLAHRQQSPNHLLLSQDMLNFMKKILKDEVAVA